MSRSLLAAGSAASWLAFVSLSSCPATVFVDQVVDYVPGTMSSPRTIAAASLGPATRVHEYGVVSPFNPAFAETDIVGIGKGGRLTVRFPQAVNVIAGLELGVITNAGLIDASYPSGTATNPAATFNAAPRVADVSISLDGTTFLPLARTTFNNPANAFVNAGPFDMAAPPAPVLADFGLPFAGSLASFDGLSWPQIVATLNGSGGGTWLDASSSGLSSFRYVRFEIPADGIAGSDDQVYIDAVVASNAAVPEPALPLTGALVGLLLRRRRR